MSETPTETIFALLDTAEIRIALANHVLRKRNIPYKGAANVRVMVTHDAETSEVITMRLEILMPWVVDTPASPSA